LSRLHLVVVVTGMHRSGTSLLASLVREAGVDMGADLVPAGKGNRRGHFEDVDFVRFHERCLERRQARALRPPESGVASLDREELGEARALLARRAGKPVWGWKDPRTTLFLEAWRSLLPKALYVLVYRHPVAVALSLLRRGLDLEVQLEPETAIRAWTAYNRQLLAFHRGFPDCCLLLPIAGVSGNLGLALDRLGRRSGLPLAGRGVARLFAPDQLQNRLLARDIEWRAILPEAMALYDQLEAAADLAGEPADRLARPEPAMSPRERDLQEASEHLLAAALGARGASSPRAPEVRQRIIDYSELKLLIARQAERIELLESQREQVGERTARLTALLAALGRDQRRVEATRAWRLVHSYWQLAGRARRWARQTGWRLRRSWPAQPPLRPEELLVGCVAENDAHSLAQALRLVWSLRTFGGSLAQADLLVCVVGAISRQDRTALERAGAEVRSVERFDRRNPSANKLQFLSEALASGKQAFLLLDHDTVFAGDPGPLLARGALQAKIADVASVTHEGFIRLFKHFGLPLPRRRYRTTLLEEPTILYCNTAVVLLPSDLAQELVPVWRSWNLRILDALEVLGPCAHHCHQASLSLALAAHPVPYAEAPPALNFPLHMTHLPRPTHVLAADPVILHYHDAVDAAGYLLPVPYPRAQARIDAFNRRLKEERSGSGLPLAPPGAPRPRRAILASIQSRKASSD
jgi:hypothetical protein